MTSNGQRAALTLAEIEQYADVRERQHILTAVLAAAEARGRAEVAQQLRDRHTRDGYGLCRECTTYSDNARDVVEPVSWPCATRHALAAARQGAARESYLRVADSLIQRAVEAESAEAAAAYHHAAAAIVSAGEA